MHLVERGCLNILYLNYINNYPSERSHSDVIIHLKNNICLFIDKITQKTVFDINVLKLILLKYSYRYKYIYNGYSNYIDEFIKIFIIKDNTTFISEFKMKINNCDNMFVLFLFFHVFEKIM